MVYPFEGWVMIWWKLKLSEFMFALLSEYKFCLLYILVWYSLTFLFLRKIFIIKWVYLLQSTEQLWRLALHKMTSESLHMYYILNVFSMLYGHKILILVICGSEKCHLNLSHFDAKRWGKACDDILYFKKYKSA